MVYYLGTKKFFTGSFMDYKKYIAQKLKIDGVYWFESENLDDFSFPLHGRARKAYQARGNSNGK